MPLLLVACRSVGGGSVSNQLHARHGQPGQGRHERSGEGLDEQPGAFRGVGDQLGNGCEPHDTGYRASGDNSNSCSGARCMCPSPESRRTPASISDVAAGHSEVPVSSIGSCGSCVGGAAREGKLRGAVLLQLVAGEGVGGGGATVATWAMPAGALHHEAMVTWGTLLVMLVAGGCVAHTALKQWRG